MTKNFMNEKIIFFLLTFFIFCFSESPAFAGGRKEAQPSGTPLDITTLEGDVSSALSAMDEASRPPLSDMTPEDEYYLGRAVAAEIFRVYKPYTSNPELISYMNRICLAVTVNSSRPTLFAGYFIEILDTDEICAFSTPGGHIFLSLGLIRCAGSEDALAAVIAHEAAHIQLRHALAIMQKERTVRELSAAADRAASIAARYASPEEKAALFRAAVTASANSLFRDGYSREQEFEADRAAVILLESALYDPSSLAELLGVLDRRLFSSGRGTGSMNATHPSPAARIASLGRVRGGYGRDTLSARRERFDTVMNSLR